MSWLKTIQWTSCAFGTAAAVALAVPLSTWAQAPAPSATTAPQSGGESAVQRELRRLYEESGREMPEVPRSIQTQRPAPPQPVVQQFGAQQPAVQQTPMYQPAQGQPALLQQPAGLPQGQQVTQAAGAEAPANTRPKSGNPVTSFFKRIIPGSSKPATTAATAPVPPSRPVVVPQQPQTAAQPGPTVNYAPYSGQQPRRLNSAGAVPPAGLPPSPQNYAPAQVATVTPAPVTAPPQVAPQVVVTPATPVANVPPSAARPATGQPVDDFNPFEVPETREGSSAPPAAVAQSSRPQRVAEPELVFAPPVILEAESAPEAPALVSPPQTVQQNALPVEMAPPPPQEVAAAPVVRPPQELATSVEPQAMAAVERAEFPDPFPEMSEEEADDELDVEDSSPFAGLALEDEPDFGTPASIGTPETAMATPEEEADPFADEPVLPKAADVEKATAPRVTAQVVATPMPQERQAVPETDAGFPALEPAMEAENPLVAKLAPLSQEPAPVADSSESLPVLKVPAPQPTLEVPSANTLPQEEIAAAKPVPAAPGLTPPVVAKPISHQPSSETDAKMSMIRERGAMKGLKGFCPVSLRDDRELRDAHSEFQAVYRGQKFHFASKAAQEKFEADGSRYVPAAYGADVVVLVRDKDVAEGTLDYAAWYKGKLYLFSSAANHEIFVNDPGQYSAPAGLE